MSDSSDIDRSAASEPPGRWPRRLPWPRDLTSAVYGSVLAASVVVGSGSSRGGWGLAVILLVTGFVFWLAHVYAETVASVHGGWNMGSIWRGMRHEWPLMFAAVPPAVAAAASGVLENLSPADGAWLALAVAVLEQQAWVLAAARRARSTPAGLARTVLLNIGIGAIIVALKLAVPGH
jgi:hypothetical protein